jgi:putative RNA 2'-phosphotransferase
MDPKRSTQLSKKLSYFLRHHLDQIPGPVDPAGYVLISSLLSIPDFVSIKATQDEILQVVATSDKQRFGLDSTGTKIRANQGHSI